VSGVLPVEKGAGVTSFQVVAHLRRVLRAAKVGHGGTLDPDATGVLPILLGEGTKLTPYLVDMDKEYVATIRLGVSTETQDLSGAVVATHPVPALDSGLVAHAVRPFVGPIRQVPPMYSALHHQGRRLYELAREGRTVDREPREVVVHAIEVLSLALPDVVLRVRCGKGTYIRTLAADLGKALGCGGALATLVRTRVGPFASRIRCDGRTSETRARARRSGAASCHSTPPSARSRRSGSMRGKRGPLSTGNRSTRRLRLPDAHASTGPTQSYSASEWSRGIS